MTREDADHYADWHDQDMRDNGETDRFDREASGYFDDDAYPNEIEREDER